MIKIKITSVDRENDNTPILSNKRIDEYAHAVMKDYKPHLLHEPGNFSFEHFIESYLGLKLLFKDIYNENEDNPILGRTIFHNSIVEIFDRENYCIVEENIRANTVIIDNSLMKEGCEGRAKFTGIHEGAHYLLHYDVFSVRRTGQICCRRDNVENFRGSPKNAEEWREQQANRFVSSFMMPDATFIPFANQLMRKYSIFKRSIILGRDDDLDTVAKHLMPEEIADIYGVSKSAAYIKLFKSGFIDYGITL